MADETQEKLEGFIVEVRGELRAIDVRLSRIEAALPTFATKDDLARIEAILPTFATKADLARIEAVLPTFATKVDLESVKAIIPTLATKADLAMLESTMLKWFVGTALTATGVASGIAFTIAKLVH